MGDWPRGKYDKYDQRRVGRLLPLRAAISSPRARDRHIPDCVLRRTAAVFIGADRSRFLASSELVDRHARDNRLGDLAQVLMMREVDHLAGARHLTEQPENLL